MSVIYSITAISVKGKSFNANRLLAKPKDLRIEMPLHRPCRGVREFVDELEEADQPLIHHALYALELDVSVLDRLILMDSDPIPTLHYSRGNGARPGELLAKLITINNSELSITLGDDIEVTNRFLQQIV